MPTIYISIAACKDPYVAQTVKSAIANADNPDSLYFGIFNTIIDDQYRVTDKEVLTNPNVVYVECNSNVPLGTGLSRLNASMLFTKQHDYLLQIDAHTIFSKGWDTYHIQQYENLLSICDKPIITYSSIDWRETTDRGICIPKETGTIFNVDPYNFDIKQMNDGKYFNNSSLKMDTYHVGDRQYHYILPFDVDWKDHDYIEHSLINASFMFTSFEINREIMHDPYQPWDGDQINFSLRTFSNGYRCFTVKDSYIFTLDKSINNNPNIDVDYIDDYKNDMVKVTNQYKDFIDLQYKNKRKYQKQIFRGEELGYWGADNFKTIKAFSQTVKADLDKTDWEYI